MMYFWNRFSNFKRLLFIAVAVLSSILFIQPSHATLSVSAKKKASQSFNTPQALKSRVNFWTKIYTTYTTNQTVIHDSNNLDIIYDVVNSKGKSPRQRERIVKNAKARYKKILLKLAKTRNTNKLSSEEKRVRRLAKNNFYKLRKSIRSQLGQADRFEEGLQRSGRYSAQMNKIFQKHGLPLDLTVLPHVESSFQIGAYSKFGAAGIWQFTRSTGRRFMTINYSIDQRRDPIIATESAARLLKNNYGALNSWPLAITAYNHGLNGMKRAQKQYGNDLAKIISRYRSRVFGFASKNFYCEFLAALHVVKNKKKYFPDLKTDPPFVYDTVTLDHYYDFNNLASRLNMAPEKMSELNPSLRPTVLNGEKRIPKGFELKVPHRTGRVALAKLNQIPARFKFAEQKRTKWYKVKKGDTLSTIARRFRTSVSKLCQLNHVRARERIYVGQVLHLPQSSSTMMAKKPKQKVRVAKKLTGDTYVVRRNDNISRVARRHGVQVASLLALNGLQKNSLIYPGQKLRLNDSVPESKKVSEKSAPAKAVKEITKTSKKSKPNTPDVKEESQTINVAALKEETQASQVSLSEVKMLKGRGGKGLLGVITVENDETLGHYSEWANLPMKEVRRHNNLRRDKHIKVGDKIKLTFAKVTPEKFEEQRLEYHHSIREDFFASFEVIRTEQIKVKRGQSLWEICKGKYDIPYWLLKDYNPEVDIVKLHPGQALNVPIVTSKNQEGSVSGGPKKNVGLKTVSRNTSYSSF